MSEQNTNNELANVIESFKSCAKAATDFSKEYKKLQRVFNSFETTVSSLESGNENTLKVIKELNSNLDNVKKLNDAVPKLLTDMKTIGEGVEEADAILEMSEERIKDFSEELEKFKEISENMASFSEVVDKFSTDNLESLMANIDKKTTSVNKTFKKSIKTFNGHIEDYKKAMKEMDSNVKKSSKDLKDAHENIKQETEDINKLLKEREDINFTNEIIIDEEIADYLAQKTADILDERTAKIDYEEIGKYINESNEELMKNIKEEINTQLDNRLPENQEIVAEFNEENMQKIIADSMKEALEESPKGSRSGTYESQVIYEAEFAKLKAEVKRQIKKSHDEISTMVDALIKESIIDNNMRILPSIEEIRTMLVDQNNEENEEDSRDLYQLLANYRKELTGTITDLIQNEVGREINKQLIILDLKPADNADIYSLEHLRSETKKFPYDVIDHFSESKDKYQIRKFTKNGFANYSVYIGEEKKKVEDLLDIHEKRYEKVDG